MEWEPVLHMEGVDTVINVFEVNLFDISGYTFENDSVASTCMVIAFKINNGDNW